MAALLVLTAALPLVLASALIVFGARIEPWILTKIGVLESGERLVGWVSFISQLARTSWRVAAIVLGTSLLYYLGSESARRLRSVYPGAILATVLWWVATDLVRLVRPEYRELQRAVRKRRSGDRAAGLDVPAVDHRAVRLRVQRATRSRLPTARACRIRLHETN